MTETALKEQKEKKGVALSSVLAAILLTSIKLIVGLFTGSLGILSEALHSGLDLIAALMTLFAVKFADKPPDEDHNYGHGKIESLSALGETVLLLVTCIWIIYEAVSRLVSGKTEIEVTFWSFAVIITSILVDIGRSRALMKVARKYKSQALEADAIHFSTDILSSGVVLIGLIGSLLNYHIADAISALIVAVIVIHISYRLGKKSIDALLDRIPDIHPQTIEEITKEINEVTKIHDIRIRSSGSLLFIDVNIHVNPEFTIEYGHSISHKVEELIKAKIGKSDIHVHIEPEEFFLK
jgi:cation diffusion facilitator family transporter